MTHSDSRFLLKFATPASPKSLKKMNFRSILITAALIASGAPNHAAAAGPCGDLENAYGPYDYSNPANRRDYLPIVEKFHFTSNVENLIKGRSDTIIGDLDYTLRAFPNHHRALYSMIRYQLDHPVQPGSQFYTAECYLDRAMRFVPTDPVPHMLAGIYYQRSNDLQKALQSYLEAYAIAPDWVELNYNLGLLYLELGDNDKALEHAHFAYQRGYALQGLKSKLTRKGLWAQNN